MAGVICFSDEPDAIWKVAGWAFHQILHDVMEQFPNDSELLAQFEQAEAISGLLVNSSPSDVADRLTNALRHVVEGILKGSIRSGIVDKPYGTPETVEQYRESLRQLLRIIPSSVT